MSDLSKEQQILNLMQSRITSEEKTTSKLIFLSTAGHRWDHLTMSRPNLIALPSPELCSILKTLQGIDQPRQMTPRPCRELEVKVHVECEFKHSPGVWMETSHETLESVYREFDMNAMNHRDSMIVTARLALKIPLVMRLPHAFRYDAEELERLVDGIDGSMDEITWEAFPWLIDIGVVRAIKLDRELEPGDLFYPPCYGHPGIRQMLVVGSTQNVATMFFGFPCRIVSLRCLFDRRNYDRITWYYDEYMQKYQGELAMFSEMRAKALKK